MPAPSVPDSASANDAEVRALLRRVEVDRDRPDQPKPISPEKKEDVDLLLKAYESRAEIPPDNPLNRDLQAKIGELVTGTALVHFSEGALPGGSPDEPALDRWHAHPLADARSRTRMRVAGAWSAPLGAYVVAPRTVIDTSWGPLSLPSLTSEGPNVPATQGVVRDVLQRPILPLKTFHIVESVSLGGASVASSELKALQSGDFDLKTKGFEQHALDIHAGASIGQYINIDALASVGSDAALDTIKLDELELWSELKKSALALRVATFRTPFGIQNMRSPGDFHFLDAPVATTRFLGPRGLAGGLGIEVVWQDPTTRLRWHGGAQNSDVDTMAPFLGSSGTGAVGGWPRSGKVDGFFERLAWYTRLQWMWGAQAKRSGAAATTGTVGASAAVGPNATGEDGETTLLGLDLYVAQLTPARVPTLIWQTEGFWRSYRADDVVTGGMTTLAARTFEDWGVYTQLLQQFSKDWAYGLRVDWLGGSSESVAADGMGGFATLERNSDPTRDDRVRLSAMLIWWKLKGLRIRAQYSLDVAEHLDDPAHIVWISFDGNWGFKN